MTFALLLDTSKRNYSVAIASEEEILSEKAAKKQDKDILPELVLQCLQEAKLQFGDLNFVGINIGPGSFTGLRVALAFAKGICEALEIPLITETSFEMLARETTEEDTIIFLHSHREIYYYAFLSLLSSPRLIDFSKAKEFPTAKFYLGEIPERYKRFPHKEILPEASLLHKGVFEKFRRKQWHPLEGIVPYYVQDFVPKKKKKSILE